MKLNRRSFLRNGIAAGAASGFGFKTVAQAPVFRSGRWKYFPLLARGAIQDDLISE
jgi:hypothetical protein